MAKAETCDWYKYFLKNNSNDMYLAFNSILDNYDILCLRDILKQNNKNKIFIGKFLTRAVEKNDLEIINEINVLYNNEPYIYNVPYTYSPPRTNIYYDEDIIRVAKSFDALELIYSKRSINVSHSEFKITTGKCNELCKQIPDDDKNGKMKCWNICQKIIGNDKDLNYLEINENVFI